MILTELRAKPHLSASSITDYLSCSQHYKFSRVDRIPREYISSSLVLGSAIHRAMEDMNRAILAGVAFGLNELKSAFERYWSESAKSADGLKYSDGENYDNLLNEGNALLETFWSEKPVEDSRVIACEEAFSVNLPYLGIPVIGVIDLLLEDENGNLIISDYKVTKKAWSASQIDENFQLSIYQLALKKMGFQNRDVMLRLECLIRNKKPKYQQYYTARSVQSIRQAETIIKAVWNGIQKGVFIPNRGNWKCNCCEYRNACDELLMGRFR